MSGRVPFGPMLLDGALTRLVKLNGPIHRNSERTIDTEWQWMFPYRWYWRLPTLSQNSIVTVVDGPGKTNVEGSRRLLTVTWSILVAMMGMPLKNPQEWRFCILTRDLYATFVPTRRDSFLPSISLTIGSDISMNADDKENGTAHASEGSTKWTIHGKHKFIPPSYFMLNCISSSWSPSENEILIKIWHYKELVVFIHKLIWKDRFSVHSWRMGRGPRTGFVGWPYSRMRIAMPLTIT